MSKNIIKEKTFRFALRIIKLNVYLNQNNCDYSLSRQILRSGTNPGAMLAEAKYAQSEADFIHKLSIAQKEINETIYWLDLLHEAAFIKSPHYNSISSDAKDILYIITSIIVSIKKKNNL